MPNLGTDIPPIERLPQESEARAARGEWVPMTDAEAELEDVVAEMAAEQALTKVCAMFAQAV